MGSKSWREDAIKSKRCKPNLNWINPDIRYLGAEDIKLAYGLKLYHGELIDNVSQTGIGVDTIFANTKADKEQVARINNNVNNINLHDVVIPVGLPDNDKENKILTFPNFAYNSAYYYISDASYDYSSCQLNTPYYAHVKLTETSEQFGDADLVVDTTEYKEGYENYCQFKVFDTGISYMYYCNGAFPFGVGEQSIKLLKAINTKADDTRVDDIDNRLGVVEEDLDIAKETISLLGNNKADKIYVDGELGKKADVSYVDNTAAEVLSIAKQYTDEQDLALGQRIDELQENKAEQSQVDSIAEGLGSVQTELTNKTAYGLGVAGLYNEDNELLKSWNKLIADGDITVSGTIITGNNLTNGGKLIIDSSITSIGSGAFIDATVTNIVIPNSMTSISDSGLAWCESLTSITIPDSVTSIGYRAFESCTSLKSITIPNSVTSIGDAPFWNCTSLTNVKLSNNLININFSFSNCGNLKSLEIPKGITVIPDSTFEGCSSLESVIIPNSVSKIEYGAFIDCNSLADVYFKGTKSQWNNITINNTDGENDYLLNATIHYELTDEVYNKIDSKANKTLNTNDHNKFISDLNYTGSTAERIAFTESGKYIKTGVSVGTVVSLTSLTDYSFNYTIIDCNAGDYFYVNTVGGNLARAWAFIDKDNKLLSKSNENVEYHGELKAPTNAKKLIVNTKCKEFYCYKGRTLKNRIAANETEITSIKNNYANINKINMHDVVIPLGIPDNDKTNQMLTFPNFVYNGIYYYVQNAEMEYVEYELNTPYYVYAELEDVSEQYGNATLSISTNSEGDGKKPYCQFKVFDGNGVSYIFYCNNVFTLGLGDKFRAIDNKFNGLSNTYLKKTDASNTYLKKTDANSTYLKKTDASRKYLKKTDYHYPIVKGYASGSNLIVTDIAPVVHIVKINGAGNSSIVTTGKNILDTTSLYMPLGEAIHYFESEFIPARIMQGDYKLVVNESWEDGLTAYISFYDITQTQIGEEIILDNTPNFHCPYYSDLYGELNGLTTSSVSSIKIKLVYGVNDSDTFTLNSLMLTLQSCSNEYEEYKPHGIYVTDETGLLELSSSNLFTGINLILGADISIEYNRDIGVVLNELLGGTT